MRGQGNLFVLGCFDDRITFYSQQVRALSLVHALVDRGYLRDGTRLAVVGAGAAGLTATAAAAVARDCRVTLFESGNDLLPLQTASTRRHIDPHIYDWPAVDALDPVADLPILDWEAGTSRSVRDDVVIGFNDIAARLDERMERRLRTKVTGLRRVDDTYEVSSTAIDGPDDPANACTARFDLVLLAIGFGLEPVEPIADVQSASYWSDAGVPSVELIGRPHPRFFVSGNGDGGLIDLVAAGERDFDHAATIRLIAKHTGIDDLAAGLQAIDECAHAAAANGTRFDIAAAYDAELLAALRAIGLVDVIAARLRPGVRLTFQTLGAKMFDVSSSILNRLAAYLTKVAIDDDPHRQFTHLSSAQVVKLPTPAGEQNGAVQLDCDGAILTADVVIVRRGPSRDDARQPFAAQLAGHGAQHRAWLAGQHQLPATVALNAHARAFFDAAVAAAHLPPSPRVQKLPGGRSTAIVQLRSINGRVRWSGARAPRELVGAWQENEDVEILLPNSPDCLGPAAGAVARFACHATNARLVASSPTWGDWLARVSIDSPHTADFAMPSLIQDERGGGARNPKLFEPERLAKKIHDSLDGWLLAQIAGRIERFIETGDDPGRLISFEAAADLRAEMGATWPRWREKFEDCSALLNCFLRLLICADEGGDHDSAQVLVGPKRLAAMVRGTAVALVVAAAWGSTEPDDQRPGNLFRQREDDTGSTAHSCAADQINGTPMANGAGDHRWRTDFVILAVQAALDLAKAAERSFGEVDDRQPALDDIKGSGPILMSMDSRFEEAARAGLATLRAHLNYVETDHLAALRKEIIEGNAT